MIVLKKIISLFLSFAVIFLCALPAFAEEPQISAKAAVVMCAESGETVYSLNKDTKLSMASTTKIMTALIALEYGADDTMITVTEEMVAVEGTSMGLKAGDSVSLKTLVKGMLLESGNDAANATACIVGGNIPNFVKMMNDKAKVLGMTSTSFETPSGLDGDNHYSTAYDMALLASYAIKNPEFRSICSAESMAVYYGSPPYRRILTNHNKLLKIYDGAFGVKTGFTKKSGRCLVSAAEKEGKTLICVTLNAPDDWNDHIKLFDYSFEKTNSHTVYKDLSNVRMKIVGGSAQSVGIEQSYVPKYTSVSDNFELSCKVYLKQFEYAPVSKGDVLGSILYFDKTGKIIFEIPLCAKESVQIAITDNVKSKAESKITFKDRILNFFR